MLHVEDGEVHGNRRVRGRPGEQGPEHAGIAAEGVLELFAHRVRLQDADAGHMISKYRASCQSVTVRSASRVSQSRLVT